MDPRVLAVNRTTGYRPPRRPWKRYVLLACIIGTALDQRREVQDDAVLAPIGGPLAIPEDQEHAWHTCQDSLPHLKVPRDSVVLSGGGEYMYRWQTKGKAQETLYGQCRVYLRRYVYIDLPH
jgi:hypothetical protein